MFQSLDILDVHLLQCSLAKKDHENSWRCSERGLWMASWKRTGLQVSQLRSTALDKSFHFLDCGFPTYKMRSWDSVFQVVWQQQNSRTWWVSTACLLSRIPHRGCGGGVALRWSCDSTQWAGQWPCLQRPCLQPQWWPLCVWAPVIAPTSWWHKKHYT